MTASISTSNNLSIRQTEEQESPLALKRREDEESDREKEKKTSSFPKSSDTILAELRRNSMHSTMTVRQIASEYNIPYIEAQSIYESLNKDDNGILTERNLPQNSTVSYLV